MQIFREVYANVYFRAVFLANVYFTYTCGKPYSAILSPPAREQRTERKPSRMRKLILIALAATCTLTLCAAKEYEWPQLPEGTLPDSEVSTNVTIHVNMSRLDEFALRIEAANCVSNEVMVAIGHDVDEDGDLSFDETAFRRDATHQPPRLRPVVESRQGREARRRRSRRSSDRMHREQAFLDKNSIGGNGDERHKLASRRHTCRARVLRAYCSDVDAQAAQGGVCQLHGDATLP